MLNFVSWNAFLGSTAVYKIQSDPVRSGPSDPDGELHATKYCYTGSVMAKIRSDPVPWSFFWHEITQHRAMKFLVTCLMILKFTGTSLVGERTCKYMAKPSDNDGFCLTRETASCTRKSYSGVYPTSRVTLHSEYFGCRQATERSSTDWSALGVRFARFN